MTPATAPSILPAPETALGRPRRGLGIADLGVASVLSVDQGAETDALIVVALVPYRVVTFVTPTYTGGVCFLLKRRSLAHGAADFSGKDAKRDRDTATGLTSRSELRER